ncbi:hypothetical protein D9615_003611 [Tricholomella constricta]|uniref:Ribonuclease H1 N-terminal domain-containing protein n=1 Tax=Tricholomella constricta TaxID=117010 RepID=A0A8H5HB64_9AGAR|nr:hypothetical protein D9615_006270 [Tricholomella constricta]KAF5383516.1 hypothetical protein D9615_003611 [Tricholomella constricta]
MVQINRPAGAGANDVITTDHIVAALQELGFLRHNLGDGSVTVTVTGASSQNSPTEPAPGTPVATIQPQTDVSSAAARERSHGQGFFVTDAQASVAASTVENTRSNISIDLRADTRSNTSTDGSEDGTAAPPTSPVSDDTDFLKPEPHVCSRCAALIPVSSGLTFPGPAPVTMPAPASGPTPTMSTVLSNTTRWYAVVIGRAVGVFQGWPTVDPLVKGVSGFRCKQYISYEDALAAFEEARSLGF